MRSQFDGGVAWQPDCLELPEQGWKVHVSARIDEADAPDGPGPARQAPECGTEPAAICRTSAQVTQVFGTHNPTGGQ